MSEPRTYRKKTPIPTTEAIQRTNLNLIDLASFAPIRGGTGGMSIELWDGHQWVRVNTNDWIIKGDDGFFSVLTDGWFKETYESCSLSGFKLSDLADYPINQYP